MPKSTVAGGVTFEPGRDPRPTGLTAGPPADVDVDVAPAEETAAVPAPEQPDAPRRAPRRAPARAQGKDG